MIQPKYVDLFGHFQYEVKFCYEEKNRKIPMTIFKELVYGWFCRIYCTVIPRQFQRRFLSYVLSLDNSRNDSKHYSKHNLGIVTRIQSNSWVNFTWQLCLWCNVCDVGGMNRAISFKPNVHFLHLPNPLHCETEGRQVKHGVHGSCV